MADVRPTRSQLISAAQPISDRQPSRKYHFIPTGKLHVFRSRFSAIFVSFQSPLCSADRFQSIDLRPADGAYFCPANFATSASILKRPLNPISSSLKNKTRKSVKNVENKNCTQIAFTPPVIVLLKSIVRVAIALKIVAFKSTLRPLRQRHFHLSERPRR